MLRGEEIDAETRRTLRLRAPRVALETADRQSPTIPPSPSRPSTSSSPTNATAPSTISGGRCWNTSTPSHRPHRHALEADHRLLQSEPRHGIQPRARRRRRRERRLRRLPHQHRDHRSAAAKVEKGFYVDKRDRQTAQSPLGTARRRPHLRRLTSSIAPSSRPTRSAPSSAPFKDKLFTEIFPGRTDRAQDAHLRQGRLPRRRHRPDRARSVRQRQRLLPRRSPTAPPATNRRKER